MRRPHVYERTAPRGPRAAHQAPEVGPPAMIMPDVGALQALLVRVKDAAGADPMLDRAILSALYLQGYRIIGAARPTASIEAAVALIKIALPGWDWSCGAGTDGNDGWVAPDDQGPDAHLFGRFEDGFIGDADGGNVPLSLISAMLQGLIAKAEAKASAQLS